jgi:16S rRNA (guanine966-N2)-methyltransferase
LRIISGYARGLKLTSPPDQAIRPTSDRAREALFNIIGNRIRQALVLDLFAGTGAFGLEALSRGARQVIFVDNNPIALLLIKKNLQLLQKMTVSNQEESTEEEETSPFSSQKPAAVIKYDLRRASFYINNERKNLPSCFDLIFLDPPYAKGLSLQTLSFLDNSPLLAKHGLLVAEDRAETELPEAFNTLKMVDRRRYGETGFWLYSISESR